MVQERREKLKPEEFEASGGVKNGKIKWITGLRLLERLGFSPEKCKIVADDAGNLNIQQKGHTSYSCAPNLWRKVSSG